MHNPALKRDCAKARSPLAPRSPSRSVAHTQNPAADRSYREVAGVLDHRGDSPHQAGSHFSEWTTADHRQPRQLPARLGNSPPRQDCARVVWAHEHGPKPGPRAALGDDVFTDPDDRHDARVRAPYVHRGLRDRCMVPSNDTCARTRGPAITVRFKYPFHQTYLPTPAETKIGN